MVLNFDSALYLGLNHATTELAPWSSLTSGVPAALRESELAVSTAQELAELGACRRGILYPSVLHAFWDVIPIFCQEGYDVYWDAAVYPLADAGIERAVRMQVSTKRFRHFDPEFLGQLIRRHERSGRTPLVVTDGYCPGCGRFAPLQDYLSLLKGSGGLILVDDTQALGVFGHWHRSHPYGCGGGGTLRHLGIGMNDHIIWLASLAKAFGAPLAVLGGGDAPIGLVARASKTREHCSAPSAASVAAARHAIAINETIGDMLRRRLAQRVALFHYLVEPLGIRTNPGLFPIQAIRAPGVASPLELYAELLAHDIRTLVASSQCRASAALTVVLTAAHENEDVEHLVAVLTRAIQRQSTGVRRRYRIQQTKDPLYVATR